MKKILQLCKHPNIFIYVELMDEPSAEQFMRELEKAGFLLPFGKKPTEHKGKALISLQSDRTILFPTFVGHMAYGCGGNNIIRLQFQNGVLNFKSIIDADVAKRLEPQLFCDDWALSAYKKDSDPNVFKSKSGKYVRLKSTVQKHNFEKKRA